MLITSELTYQNTLDFFKKNINKINWKYVGSNSNGYSSIDTLNFKFIHEFHDYINWCLIGNGSYLNTYQFKKIELLSFEFIDEFKNYLRWNSVGSGLKLVLPSNNGFEIYINYTPIEKLPTNFIDRYINKINWDFIGSGLINNKIGNYKKIEELPLSFVEKYKNNILWLYVGSGQNNHLGNFTHINNLPSDFKEKFQDKINICDFLEHNITSENIKTEYIEKKVIPQHFKKIFINCYLVSASSIKCSICLDNIRSNIHITNCGHIYHKKCIDFWKEKQLNLQKECSCPECRYKL